MNSHLNALIIGASQGIGLGFVEKALENSQFGHIFATYRQESSADKLLALKCEITGRSAFRGNLKSAILQADSGSANLALETTPTQYSDRLSCLQVDITQESQIAAAVQEISTTVDKLHLVIYCVGVLHQGELQPEKSLRQIVPENLIYYFQVNSIGAVLWAKHLMPLLNHRDRNIFASISAKVGSIGDNYLGGWYGYRASKAALNMFLRTTAIEYSRRCRQTIVVALHPGTTDTRLSQPFQKNVPPEKLFPVEKTVNQLWTVMEGLTIKDSGKFFSWDGTVLPW